MDIICDFELRNLWKLNNFYYFWILLTSISLNLILVVVGTQDTQKETTFEARAYKYHRKWTFIHDPLSHCIFYAENNRNRGLDISTVCREKLSSNDLSRIRKILTVSGPSFSPDYLDISCYGDENVENACVCGKYIFDNPLNDTLPDMRETNVVGAGLQNLGACKQNWIISSEQLEPFEEVKVLSIGSPSVKVIEVSNLKNLELLIIKDSSNLMKESFKNFTFCEISTLEVVTIENTLRVSELPTQWFSNGEIGSCEKSFLHTIILENNHIHHLQNNLFTPLQFLRSVQLRNNHIRTLNKEAFAGLHNLNELSLGHNEIITVPEKLFAFMPSLLYLDLSYNKLSSMNASDLIYQQSLVDLDLSHNVLSSIEGSFNVLPHIVYLNLSHNALQMIENITFKNCFYIGKLHLNNNNISYIQENAFKGVLFLKFLDLSYNQISDAYNLRQNLWKHLERMQILNLGFNKLEELLPKMFQLPSYLTSLVLLQLSDNRIRTIHPDAFLYQSNLQRLYMANNPLANLSTNILRHMTRLLDLDIGQCNLTKIPPEFFLPTLTWMTLSGNRLESVPRINHTLNILLVLILTNNNIAHISQADFDPFPNLIGLNLTRNRLSEIKAGTFVKLNRLIALDISYNNLKLNFSKNIFLGQYSLHQLFLSHNAIDSLTDLFRHTIRSVTDVDLSYNPITKIPDQPKKDERGADIEIHISRLWLRNCNISSIAPSAFDKAFNLGYLDLSGNQLKEFKPPNVSKLSRHYLVDLSNNPLQCSCRMKWLLSGEYSVHYHVENCQDQYTNQIVPFKELNDGDFLCRSQFGAKCLLDQDICKCFTNDPETFATTVVDCSYKNLQAVPSPIPKSVRVLNLEGNTFTNLYFPNQEEDLATEKLFLGDSNIQHIRIGTFKHFPNLLSLHLNDNKIGNVSSGMFSNLFRLKVLSLASNEISVLQAGAFDGLISLEQLELHNNQMEHLEPSLMEEVSSLKFLKHLSLEQNPWSCDCDNVTFKNWLQSHADIIINLTAVACNDTTIMNIPDEELLCYDNFRVVIQEQRHTTAVILISVFAVMAVLLIIGLLLAYLNRFALEVLVFYKFGIRFKVKENPNCAYDAYAAYDDEILEVRLWVRDVLINKLEPGFHLCIPDRDILPGTVKCDAVADAIEQSRRTLLVISSTGLENENLLFAFQTAYYRMKFEDATHKIYVLLLNGVNEKSLMQTEGIDPHLKAMLKTGLRFCEEDKLFWEKITFSLPHKDLKMKDNRKCESYDHRSSVASTSV